MRMGVKRYAPREPVEVQALQVTEDPYDPSITNLDQCADFVEVHDLTADASVDREGKRIAVVRDSRRGPWAGVGDYVVIGVTGHAFTRDQEQFEKTYVEVDGDE